MSAVLDKQPQALPSDWYWTTMGEIAEVVGGGTPRTHDSTNFDGGDIPWITPADLSGYTEKYVSRGARFITRKGLESSSARLLPAGTVLFTSRAPIGYVAIARYPLATNQGFKSFVLKGGVLPEYVYWWLKGSKQRAEALASGTTFLELSGANAKKLPIPVAPIHEQRRIVAEIEKQFSRLDEAVANLRRVRANLKRYKAAVLKAAVEGRLVPTEAELAGHDGRGYETGEQLLKRLLESHGGQGKGKGKGSRKEPAPVDVTGLPNLPEGWTWATIEQLTTELVNGFGKRFQIAGHPKIVLRLADIVDGEISFADVRRINCVESEVQRYGLATKDLLILRVNGSSDLVGRMVLVPQTSEETLFCDHFIRARCPSVELAQWLRIYSDTTRFRRYVDVNKVSSAGQNTISQGTLLPFAVPLPPSAEQQRIFAEIERIQSGLDAFEAQLAASGSRSAGARHALLTAAFKGAAG